MMVTVSLLKSNWRQHNALRYKYGVKSLSGRESMEWENHIIQNNRYTDYRTLTLPNDSSEYLLFHNLFIEGGTIDVFTL